MKKFFVNPNHEGDKILFSFIVKGGGGGLVSVLPY